MPVQYPYLPPQLQTEQEEIERKRRMADTLLGNAMQPQQGQMVGNYYVAPNPLTNVLSGIGATLAGKRQDERQSKLIGKANKIYSDAASAFSSSLANATTPEEFNRSLTAYGTSIGRPDIGVQPAIQMAQRNMALRMAGLPTMGGQPQPVAPSQQQPQSQALSMMVGSGDAPDWARTASAPSPSPAPTQTPFGNVPQNVAAMLLSQDPGIQKLGQAMLEQDKPIVGREGAPILRRMPDGSLKVDFYAPKTEAGVQLDLGPGGAVQGAKPIPGYTNTISDIEGAKARAQAQFKPVEYPAGRGATRIGSAAELQPQPQPPTSGSALSSFSPMLNPALRTQTTAEKAESQHYGEGLGKAASDVNAAAATAAVGNRYLDVMEETVKSFEPGKLAPLQSSMIQWAEGAGLPVTADMRRQAGDIQSLTSMGIKMAGQATRQSDAQPSQLQYMKMLESMPNAERTPEGFAKIVGYLRDTNNQAIAKAQALQQWKGQHGGSAEGFDAAWPAMAAKLPFAWNRQPATTPPAQPGTSTLSPAEEEEFKKLRQRFDRRQGGR